MSAPAVIYAAKSTKDRHLSIPEQLDDCREMASENGWEILGEFSDENFTAYTGNRGPGLASAIELAKRIAAERGQVFLVAQHTSRFARGDGAAPDAPRALVELWHEWARANVRGRTVENDSAMSSSANAAAQGEADHNESKRKSKSVKKGLRRRARDRGKLSGGPRPYGYQWADGGLVQVPTEASIVRRLFEQTIAGMSQRALARSLNSEGVPSASGKPWAQSTIAQLLANPLYKGVIRHDGSEYEGEHEAIVELELWECATMVRSNAVRRSGGRWPKGTHLLTGGLLRCSCGYAMVRRTDPGRRNYEVYECRGRREHGVGFCTQGAVRRELVDEALFTALTTRWTDLEEQLRQMEAAQHADLAVAREALAQAERDATAADARLARVRGHYQDGKIEADDWAEQRPGLVAEAEGAREAVLRAQEHVQMLERGGVLEGVEQAFLERVATVKEAIAQGVESAPDLNALRIHVRDLFEKVVLYPTDHPRAQLLVGATAAGDYLLDPTPRAGVLDRWLIGQGPTLPLDSRLPDRDTLASTSSPPRSSTRIR